MFQSTDPRLRARDTFLVIRQPLGAMVVDANGELITTLNEEDCHAWKLKSGKLVIIPKPKQPKINRVLPELISDYGDLMNQVAITTISKAKITELNGQLVATNRWLPAPVPVTDFMNDVPAAPNDQVDLAWFKQTPEQIYVRQYYPAALPANLVADSQLDLDLHGQTVAVVVGQSQGHEIYEQLVAQYHGVAKVVEGFSTTKKWLIGQLQSADLVIVITAFASHATTWSTRDLIKKLGIQKYAVVTKNKANGAFVRALYRAEHQLPAYETPHSQIEYPTK